MADEYQQSARLDRVETEVAGMRSDVATLTRDFDTVKGDVRSLGAILGRIETGVERAQVKSEERTERNKPNMTAIITILITIISILVGGAWMVSGQLATLNARTQEYDRLIVLRTGQVAHIEDEIDKLKDHNSRSDHPSPEAAQ